MVSNPSRSWQLQTKTCISGFACSNNLKSASAAGAEEIITIDSTAEKAMQQHVVEHGEHDKAQQTSCHPLHPGLAPDVVTSSCLWIRASFPHTIIQFTAHVILISNTYSQQAHICKSYKSPVVMSERRSSR